MSHHHHYHDKKSSCRGNGPIRRVTQGIADRIGVKRKFVLFAFIIGAIINFPLALIAFFVALYWIDNPGKLEEKAEKFEQKIRKKVRNWHKTDSKKDFGFSQREAYANGPSETYGHDDFEFSDLREQFEDLESRAADMEDHVSAKEYKLNKEFKKMKDEE